MTYIITIRSAESYKMLSRVYVKKCTIHSAGFPVHPNAERYLKPIEEMTRLFRHYPEALLQTQGIAEACTFSLDQLKYQYP